MNFPLQAGRRNGMREKEYLYGRLGYNTDNDRYGLLDSDLWLNDGFRCDYTVPRHYTYPEKLGKVIIPFHKGKDIYPVTEKSIRKQAGLL